MHDQHRKFAFPKNKFEQAGVPDSLRPQPRTYIDGGGHRGGVKKATERFGIFFASRCADSVCPSPVFDPSQEDYQQMLEWAGGRFHPEEFDLQGVNGIWASTRRFK